MVVPGKLPSDALGSFGGAEGIATGVTVFVIPGQLSYDDVRGPSWAKAANETPATIAIAITAYARFFITSLMSLVALMPTAAKRPTLDNMLSAIQLPIS